MTGTVRTADSSQKAIVIALKVHWFVKVVDVIAIPYTVSPVIINRTIATFKIMDAIFFAISVLTLPFPQVIALIN